MLVWESCDRKSIDHFTTLAQLLLRGLSRTEQQLLLTVPTVRNVSCIVDVLSDELITEKTIGTNIESKCFVAILNKLRIPTS